MYEVQYKPVVGDLDSVDEFKQAEERHERGEDGEEYVRTHYPPTQTTNYPTRRPEIYSHRIYPLFNTVFTLHRVGTTQTVRIRPSSGVLRYTTPESVSGSYQTSTQIDPTPCGCDESRAATSALPLRCFGRAPQSRVPLRPLRRLRFLFRR